METLILSWEEQVEILEKVKEAMRAPGGAKPTVFYKFDGIDSESSNDKYKSWSEAYYHYVSVAQPTSTGYTSAMATGTAGRSVLAPITLAGPVTKATPKYFVGGANGDQIKNLKIAYVIPHGKEQVEYMTVTCEPVTIVGHTIAEPATAGKAVEILKVIAGKVEVKHGQVSTNYNFQQAKSD